VHLPYNFNDVTVVYAQTTDLDHQLIWFYHGCYFLHTQGTFCDLLRWSAYLWGEILNFWNQLKFITWKEVWN